MSTRVKTLITFGICNLVFVILFTAYIPWNKFPDPDALYHATMAKLTWEQGAVTQFPWLDMTTLGTHFADQHFLLHVIQSPFVHYFGITLGSRISSLFIAVFCMFGIAFIFYKLRLRPFWLWPVLLALSNPFLSRMVLGKASPLTILLWLVGLATMMKIPLNLPLSRETSNASEPLVKGAGDFIIFLVSFLFTLTHGGWIILPGSILILTLPDLVRSTKDVIESTKYGVRSTSIRVLRTAYSVLRTSYSVLVPSLLGVALGLLVHPGRRELLSLLWVQVYKIGIMTPGNILPMGIEWAPASFEALLAMTSVFGVILILIIPGLIIAKKLPLTKGDKGGSVPGWSLLVIVLFALTLKSARFGEYLQPALAVWIAMLAQLVDWKKLFELLRFGEGKITKHLMTVVMSVSMLAVIVNSVLNGYFFLQKRKTFFDNQYLGATQAISDQAKPGDRVYHSQWDEFPMLFSRDQRLKYVAGLDPTFFYEATSTLALDYYDLTAHTASSTADDVWSVVHDRLGAKFAMIDQGRWPDLAKIFAQDKRYIKIGEGEGGVAYRVEDVP